MADKVSSVSMPLMAQFEAAKSIPMAVLSNWPTYFGFTFVNIMAGYVLQLIPRFGGAVGTVESAAINGMVQVLDHVTWEKLGNKNV